MPPSERDISRRLRKLKDENANGGRFAYVGDTDGVTVAVPDTTNQTWIRLSQNANETHPAYWIGSAWSYDDIVWVELLRGEYWIKHEYTLTP